MTTSPLINTPSNRSKINIDYSVITTKGIDRTQNQDSYLIENSNSLYFFVVADGLGGLCNGDQASNLAVSMIKKELHQDNLDCEDLVTKAHEAVRKEAEQAQKTMATTIVLCRVDPETGEVTVAHVGDSRAYLFGAESWRTKDHSPVQDLVDLGILSEEDAFGHPELHRMTQALGIKQDIVIDCHTMTMPQGTILLCSDGLHNYLKDTDIQELATKYSLDKAVDLLMKKAQKNGSTDDITLILVKLDEKSIEKPKKMKTKIFTPV
jgi:protein phosphatase